jgi:hypothetical protein
MALNLVNQLSEWNPQWFRELKGRLKPRNILITVAVSFISQLLLLMSFASQLPVPDPDRSNIHNRYCTEVMEHPQYQKCIADGAGGFVIHWELWWKDVFVTLSIMGIFALLVAGTYMLISDLAKEERRGTLNFLRLTPHSSASILMGKMLGVPILLYLMGFLALPLHGVAGLSAQIPLAVILGYYGVLGASCLFFYSVALLFGLVGKWLGGFQAWLGGGAMLMFLYPMLMMLSHSSYITYTSWDWLLIFNPQLILPFVIGANSLDASRLNDYSSNMLSSLHYFSVPVGISLWSIAGLMVFNYGLWTYWVWQGLERCFHNPSATLLGKQQSYWMTLCFEVVILGFALNPEQRRWMSYAKELFENFQILLVFNLLLFLVLIAALSPQRQAMQDWVRYRHKQSSPRRTSVMQDLIWGEKSPSLVAIALNLAIASSILLAWILLWPNSEYKTPALWGLSVSAILILVYAAIAQLILLTNTPKRALWAATTLGGLIVLPPITFVFLSMEPQEHPGIWLFSAFPWASLEYVMGISVVLAVVGQSLMLGLLSIQLTRQLRKAGESSTKRLLSEHPSLPVS